MSDDKKYDLLLDLAKLIKKYGVGPFNDLSADLSSPFFKNNFSELLFKIAKTAEETGFKESKPAKRKQVPRSFRSRLLKIQEEQPEKGKLLLKLFDDLSLKKFLPTLRDIRNFIADNGLQPLNVKSRKNAIIPFVKQLITLETSDIEKIITDIRPFTESDDRSLGGWSDIILKNKPKNSEEQKPLKQEDSNSGE